jgi:hypothetical protein
MINRMLKSQQPVARPPVNSEILQRDYGDELSASSFLPRVSKAQVLFDPSAVRKYSYSRRCYTWDGLWFVDPHSQLIFRLPPKVQIPDVSGDRLNDRAASFARRWSVSAEPACLRHAQTQRGRTLSNPRFFVPKS